MCKAVGAGTRWSPSPLANSLEFLFYLGHSRCQWKMQNWARRYNGKRDTCSQPCYLMKVHQPMPARWSQSSGVAIINHGKGKIHWFLLNEREIEACTLHNGPNARLQSINGIPRNYWHSRCVYSIQCWGPKTTYISIKIPHDKSQWTA